MLYWKQMSRNKRIAYIAGIALLIVGAIMPLTITSKILISASIPLLIYSVYYKETKWWIALMVVIGVLFIFVGKYIVLG